MNGKIGEYTFELDTALSRIDVYQPGEGSEPSWYIPVGRDIDEKTFHDLIMESIQKRLRIKKELCYNNSLTGS